MQPQQLRQLSRQLVRQLGMLNSQCGQLALTPVQAHTLIELEQGPCTVNQMAERLRVDKSNASRNLAMLLNQGLIDSIPNPDDKRSQLSQLTSNGKRTLTALHHQLDQDTQAILDQLDQDEIDQLESSLLRYYKALTITEHQQGYTIRAITPLDNAAVAALIRRVSAEYGLTPDKGFSVADPHLDDLCQHYQTANSCYWVIEKNNRILGCGGIAPLAGDTQWSELQKVFFLPELRGKGLARTLTVKALKFARENGFKGCYLETTEVLKEAVKLYQSLGFVDIPTALGSTGHDACEIHMLKTF
ncbi:bifunctional helix-turn-helix transcriptional regulator/GNAT family N-acetyltransferase [Photobacterium leiognathi]|uniref:bifunctional helix-turn-helix transcriptional regulator/GNAT family N-acetyltransferase n=1 Tax=Photobacterium leiognathi TaxID=553611 RepID=UPI000D16B1A4|nr:helix-turn-helix domain-containing GNAT family N-acetyltransferase [Photobacterium leiognathi]PSW42315.1 MarR family transcriptional regulator [Photobacterium leiognathi subsp. mandapamensis]